MSFFSNYCGADLLLFTASYAKITVYLPTYRRMLMRNRKKIFRILIIVPVCALLLGLIGIAAVDGYVRATAGNRILTSEEAAKVEDVDCILVLGCLVKQGGIPSDMLHGRLRRGVELYNMAAASKLLMSGDHGTDGYDEVDAMKQFAVDEGIPSSDVFMDHAGFSTYESVYRAKEVFGAKKIIIVTQEYHLYRAIYIAE